VTLERCGRTGRLLRPRLADLIEALEDWGIFVDHPYYEVL
jgi:hypothetical protein